ncbi:Uncharacterised protein [Cedecea neteri]|uniref:Uncharacterized protein n=1 Tax=Cedecea neteri TaxID=158822 RepID=A0A2X3JFH2_9ENTR|nr:Uncharacterised protein [Cedecea neteri]
MFNPLMHKWRALAVCCSLAVSGRSAGKREN